mgnify:CR=1 FL=1
MFLMRFIAVTCCLVALSPLAVRGQEEAVASCPPLDEIRAEAARATPQAYAVTRDYTDNRGDTRHRRARFDPRRDAANAWSLEQRNKAAPGEKFLRKYSKDPPPPPPSYARVAAVLAGEAQCVEADDARAVYAVDRLGAGAILLDGDDISAHFSARVTVDRAAAQPYVSAVHFSLESPFKAHFLVRITEAEGSVVFARRGPGSPVILSQEFVASGSKPFGSFDYETRSSFSDHAPVAAP